MIPHRIHGANVRQRDWNELEEALGLPPSPLGRRYADAWDDIAHHCHLPDCTDLKLGIESPGIDTLPSWLWNRAVDIANKQQLT